MSVLKTILIVLLVYYGLKLLIRFATPYILRYISKKAGQQFEQFFGNPARPDAHQQKEGQVTIDNIPSQNKSSGKKVGEYVDFEEVE
ncbi:DUF4834 family protein [Aequorivita sp. H23M31]|uniref:DUF4834 family protein n=2 Tax=Aequorivita ciconiae TaxID=2494375 RepID=A0A410G768_9FLAO|nr:DUF4834 family protein [Aequorivita sp. H23M31]